MSNFEGTNFLDFKSELLRDGKERKEYERLKPKYDMIEEVLKENEELKEKIAKLERIIERLVRDASFNACQPSHKNAKNSR